MSERDRPVDTTLDLDGLSAVLRESPISLAVLYGSHARGDAGEGSDVDLAVEFEDGLTPVERTHARLDLLERLSTTLGTDDVDVVPLASASPELLATVLTEGVVLYGSRERLERYAAEASTAGETEESLAAFDDVLSRLERVV